jgi:hypothetical protein
MHGASAAAQHREKRSYEDLDLACRSHRSVVARAGGGRPDLAVVYGCIFWLHVVALCTKDNYMRLRGWGDRQSRGRLATPGQFGTGPPQFFEGASDDTAQ